MKQQISNSDALKRPDCPFTRLQPADVWNFLSSDSTYGKRRMDRQPWARLWAWPRAHVSRMPPPSRVRALQREARRVKHKRE